ncbi:odorant receptor [Trichonephila clavipes]|nr:odorant receptor [Trichonephila clavipes]
MNPDSLWLQHQDGRIRVQWHRGECTLAACIRYHHTDPSAGMMLWGAIGYTSRSLLVRMDGTLNSPRCIFDLSPVENVWSMVVEQLAGYRTPVTTVDERRYGVEATWSFVPVHGIQFPFDSMPRRISAVITARGACFWY